VVRACACAGHRAAGGEGRHRKAVVILWSTDVTASGAAAWNAWCARSCARAVRRRDESAASRRRGALGASRVRMGGVRTQAATGEHVGSRHACAACGVGRGRERAWSEGGERPVAGSELLCSVRCAAGRNGGNEREGGRKRKRKEKGKMRKRKRKKENGGREKERDLRRKFRQRPRHRSGMHGGRGRVPRLWRKAACAERGE